MAEGEPAEAAGEGAWSWPRCTGTGRWRRGSKSAAGSTARWASVAAPASAPLQVVFAATRTEKKNSLVKIQNIMLHFDRNVHEISAQIVRYPNIQGVPSARRP